MNTANSKRRRSRPVIGVSSGRTTIPVTEGALHAHYVGLGYVRAVVRGGGVPLVLPAVDEEPVTVAEATLDLLDGLLLSGGCDLSPALYGAADDDALDPDPIRDAFELELLAGAEERGLPVLGICRGMELINVARGGTLRDGVEHPRGRDVHVEEIGVVRTHDVLVEAGTLAHAVLGRTVVDATCVHHQAPELVGQGLVASVLATDGAIEAVEDAERRLLGVIWHPELGLDRAPTHQLLYDWIVREAARGARVPSR